MKQSERTAEIEAIAELSYNQLQGEWLEWLEVAKRYEYKVPYQDRHDIRHDILIELARARARDGKPLPPLRAYRIASLMVALYWRTAKRIPTMLSLDSEFEDSEGTTITLKDTVASDKAVDMPDKWFDITTWLLGCPMRLIQIANKKLDGKPLNAKDRMYLYRYRRQEQKKLL